ncbi:MAG TPA: nickel-responsive transcriptional regulator NikR [Coriobacteriia bacterium]|nr:nickel-responsive transcriptional regulator NikR [Coriobacteriia bacterium]
MPDVVRFGVSTDERLLDKFDALIDKKGYVNRSEAVRDLIRNALVEDQWESGDETAESVGTVTLVFDHHSSDLSDKLTEHQHSHHEEIVSTLHIHLDAHNCLEVVVLRGSAQAIKKIADGLIGTKGVKHGQFVATTTGHGLV